MNIKTIDDIRALKPCYDPATYLPEDWTGTALDIMKITDCPPVDRLWVVLRSGWIDDRTLRLFAVWCAREALKLVDNPDTRSVEACNVAERYTNEEATAAELDASGAASGAAAGYAAWAAARVAARVAAGSAARVAARAAAGSAARVAARAAAGSAARAAQAKKLIEMLEEQP